LERCALCSRSGIHRIRVENGEEGYMPKVQKVDPRKFWIGVGIGLIAALIIDILVAIGGAFIGGVVAGWLASGGKKGGKTIGGKAGLFAGLLNAVVLAVFLAVVGIEAAPSDLTFLRFLGSTFFIALMLFPLLGFVGYLGGVLGGALKER
jgi:hypothetical protein